MQVVETIEDDVKSNAFKHADQHHQKPVSMRKTEELELQVMKTMKTMLKVRHS